MYKDIIERAIEQFAASIAKIMSLRREKKEEEAEQIIETELLKLSGMPLKNILSIPGNISIDLLSKKYSDRAEHRIHIADLLKEHGQMMLEKSSISEAIKSFQLALGILEDVSKNDKFKENKKVLQRIKKLRKMIS